MGDRAVVHFVNSTGEVSPAVYLHWQGSVVGELLAKCQRLMRARPDDAEYTSARFVGIVHETMPDKSLSLGVWNAPEGGRAALRDPSYSHGDAGVFIVDVSKREWRIEAHGGYAFPDVQRLDKTKAFDLVDGELTVEP